MARFKESTDCESPYRVNIGRIRTLASCGLIGDDPAFDNGQLLQRAFALGVPLDGADGKWYALSGFVNVVSGLRLHHAWLRPFTATVAMKVLTSPGAIAAVTDVLLDRVRIDRNGSPSVGTVGNSGALWFDSVHDLKVIEPEIFGDGCGNGIRLVNCQRPFVVRPNIHELNASANTDPDVHPSVQLLWGISCTSCTDGTIEHPTIRKLLCRIVDGPYTTLTGTDVPLNVPLPYQSDGIGLEDCSGFTIDGGHISEVGTGIDIHGNGQNRRHTIIGSHLDKCGAFGLKIVRDAAFVSAIGVTSSECGNCSFAIGASRPNEGDLHGLRNVSLSDVKSYNAGAPYTYDPAQPPCHLWGASGIAGLRVFSSGTTMYAVSVRIAGFDAIDDQPVPTMKYGILRDNTHDDVKLYAASISGATVAECQSIVAVN